MTEADIPQHVRDFVIAHIDSVLQLEVLLMLFAQPDHGFGADDISRQMHLDAAWVAEQLAGLCAAGALTCTPPPNQVYRYQPARPEIDQAVRGLADAYAQRRVSVIGLIFSKPIDRLKSFADAFRLRKDNPGG